MKSSPSSEVSVPCDLDYRKFQSFGKYRREWNLISVGKNKRLSLWDWKSGRLVGKVEDAHSRMILSAIEYRKDRYATASSDEKVSLWNCYDQEIEYHTSLCGHAGDVNCLAHISDGIVASGSDDCTLRIWNTKDLECVQIFRNHDGDVRDCKAIDSINIASGSYDRTVRIFDLVKLRQKLICRKHTSRVRCLESVNSRELLFSGSYGRRCIIWDLRQNRAVKVIKEKNWVNSLHFFSPRNLLLTGDDHGNLGFWDIRYMKKLGKKKIHRTFVTCIISISKGRMDEDISCVSTSSTDGTIAIVQIRDGKVIKRMDEKEWVFCILNHELSSQDNEMMRIDFKERTEYINKNYCGLKIKFLRPKKRLKQNLCLNISWIFLKMNQ